MVKSQQGRRTCSRVFCAALCLWIMAQYCTQKSVMRVKCFYHKKKPNQKSYIFKNSINI